MGSTSAAVPPAPPRLAIYQPLLDRLDEAALTPIVRRALRHRGAVPVSWRWAPVSYAAYYPRRLLVRVKGEADVRGRAVPWAAVIKIVEPPDADETIPGAARPATWDREVRAYRSGLLAHLPGGVAAPRVLRVDTFPSGPIWLWLEHVEDAYGGQW